MNSLFALLACIAFASLMEVSFPHPTRFLNFSPPILSPCQRAGCERAALRALVDSWHERRKMMAGQRESILWRGHQRAGLTTAHIEDAQAVSSGNGIQGNLNIPRPFFQHEDEQVLEELVIGLMESLCLEMDNSIWTWCWAASSS